MIITLCAVPTPTILTKIWPYNQYVKPIEITILLILFKIYNGFCCVFAITGHAVIKFK